MLYGLLASHGIPWLMISKRLGWMICDYLAAPHEPSGRCKKVVNFFATKMLLMCLENVINVITWNVIKFAVI